MITFNRFKGSKGLFEEYKKEGLLDLNKEAIVFIYDDKDRYIYDCSTDTYFGSTEIYIGNEQPESSDIVVWYDTSGADVPDEPFLTTVTWEDIEDKPDFAEVAYSGEFDALENIPDFTLTHIGEEEPEINSDFNRWINPNEDSFDGVDVYNALIEYVNTKFKAIDNMLELIIGEEI